MDKWFDRKNDRAPKLMRALDTVPVDSLRAFSRAWNRACLVIAGCGLLLAALVLFSRGG